MDERPLDPAPDDLHPVPSSLGDAADAAAVDGVRRPRERRISRLGLLGLIAGMAAFGLSRRPMFEVDPLHVAYAGAGMAGLALLWAMASGRTRRMGPLFALLVCGGVIGHLFYRASPKEPGTPGGWVKANVVDRVGPWVASLRSKPAAPAATPSPTSPPGEAVVGGPAVPGGAAPDVRQPTSPPRAGPRSIFDVPGSTYDPGAPAIPDYGASAGDPRAVIRNPGSAGTGPAPTPAVAVPPAVSAKLQAALLAQRTAQANAKAAEAAALAAAASAPAVLAAQAEVKAADAEVTEAKRVNDPYGSTLTAAAGKRLAAQEKLVKAQQAAAAADPKLVAARRALFEADAAVRAAR